MTNFERIKAMSIDELTEYLNKINYDGELPSDKWFNENYCKKCPEIECTDEKGKTQKYVICDFVGEECPHGDGTKLWLESEVTQ
jgi:hypothetical protein